MLSQSLVKGYGRKYLTPRCLIKVDIRKAFDSLQWSFIENILLALKFPPQFISWIMGCLTSSWFSPKLNGSVHGFFQGKSGVEQGDPLSPYIFVLSMEILSRYLRCLNSHPQVSLHPKCSKMKLTHLIFLDDLMIFIRGDVPYVLFVSQTLGLFSSWHGLQANVDKTEIYFGGVSPSIKSRSLTSGFSEGSFPFRLQLLNSVVFGIENFWCASVLLPKSVFGVKEILSWNKALISKWLWLLDQTPQGLWSIWHSEYHLSHCSIWDAAIHDRYSESFRSIISVKNDLLTVTGSPAAARALLHSWCSGDKFQVAAAYNWFRLCHPTISWSKGLFHKVVVPRHSIINSLACQQKLATVDKLILRGFITPNRCVLCKQDSETHDHLFFACPFSQQLWHELMRKFVQHPGGILPIFWGKTSSSKHEISHRTVSSQSDGPGQRLPESHAATFQATQAPKPSAPGVTRSSRESSPSRTQIQETASGGVPKKSGASSPDPMRVVLEGMDTLHRAIESLRKDNQDLRNWDCHE
ncbi:uncharacterized protein LOC141630827 [Silene latifolia]|uniref:uncharacterized protein LOC141630827 n=1 Tax=Silene latifolia TaxID=37657 RepID=UPI003D780D9F